MENNYSVSMEVRRRITTKDGRTYSADMQLVTANAACSIAYRNAVLRVVPKAVIKRVLDSIKAAAIAGVEDPFAQWGKIVNFFASKGIPEGQVLNYISLRNPDEITAEHIIELRGLATAIQEGSMDAAELYRRAGANRRGESPRADQRRHRPQGDGKGQGGQVGWGRKRTNKPRPRVNPRVGTATSVCSSPSSGKPLWVW